MMVVDVTSEPVTTVLVVRLATMVVVVNAVTTGRLLVGVGIVGVAVRLIVDEADTQVCSDPIPTLKGCLSTRAKWMKLVDAKKFASWYCTTASSESCCEKGARLQMLDPGPKLWYSPY